MFQTQKKIFQSTIYNLTSTYLSFIINLIITFFIARMINAEDWGLLILSQSYISIAILICNFFPPAAESSIQYYIPFYINKNANRINKIRILLYHTFKIRIIISIIFYLLSLVFFSFFFFNSMLYSILLIILPIIILQSIKNLNSSILLAFKNYKKNFYITIINPIIYSFSVIIIAGFNIKSNLIMISFAYLSGFIFSFIISLIFIRKEIPTKNYKGKVESMRKEIMSIHKNYGMNLAISALLTQLIPFFINILFINLNFVNYITFFAVCLSAERLISNLSISNENIYVSIFSEIGITANRKIFKLYFYQLNKFLSLFTIVVIGFMYFFIEIYILLIYSQTYLIILNSIKIFLFIAFANLILRNLGLIAQSTDNTIVILRNSVFKILIIPISSILIFVIFNFYIFSIVYVISHFLIVPIFYILINRSLKLNLSILLIFKPFLLLVGSLILSEICISFIQFNSIIEIELVGKIINKLVGFFLFLIYFSVINYMLKYIRKNEIIDIIELSGLGKLKWVKKILMKLTNILPS